MAADESYEAALDAISSLVTGRKRTSTVNWVSDFESMQHHLKQLGMEDAVRSLPVIHVAGTKGKGSTCAFVDSILRAHGVRTGLYTSPHLVDVRERIRIGGRMLPKSEFARRVWALRHRLDAAAAATATAGPAPPAPPTYFRFLTLLALATFVDTGVDVAVLEVGLGGRLDATNCVPSPLATGVSALGYDHTELLGDTLALIAAEKAGIFKPGVAAVAAPQPPEAWTVLESRATVVRTLGGLTPAPPLVSYRGGQAAASRLGLAGAHQADNAALAVALCCAAGHALASTPGRSPPWAQALVDSAAALDKGELPPAYAAGLADARWPGRGQIEPDVPAMGQEGREVDEEEEGNERLEGTGDGVMAGAGSSMPSPRSPNLTFFLDGAHTAESMAACGAWFASAAASESPDALRLLIFNCLPERSPPALLAPLAAAAHTGGSPLHRGLFTPHDSQGTGLRPGPPVTNTAWQRGALAAWVALPYPTAQPPHRGESHTGVVVGSLGAALDAARRAARVAAPRRVQVLVTGSLYLVGDVLRLLGRRPR